MKNLASLGAANGRPLGERAFRSLAGKIYIAGVTGGDQAQCRVINRGFVSKGLAGLALNGFAIDRMPQRLILEALYKTLSVL